MDISSSSSLALIIIKSMEVEVFPAARIDTPSMHKLLLMSHLLIPIIQSKPKARG